MEGGGSAKLCGHEVFQGGLMPRLVKCAKLGQELPGMNYKPFNNELGRKIYDNISQQAWMEWIEFSKRIVNEFRLDLGSAAGQKLLLEQAEQFFFGTGGSNPPEYVP
jgi:Fe-S cluster biosynthesis and repair protein YggX